MTPCWRVTLRTRIRGKNPRHYWDDDLRWDGSDLVELLSKATQIAEGRRAWWHLGKALAFEYDIQLTEPPR